MINDMRSTIGGYTFTCDSCNAFAYDKLPPGESRPDGCKFPDNWRVINGQYHWCARCCKRECVHIAILDALTTLTEKA